MIAILPDNGIEYYFNTVEEFLCWQLKDHNPGWLEVTTERMKLTGTLEELKLWWSKSNSSFVVFATHFRFMGWIN